MKLNLSHYITQHNERIVLQILCTFINMISSDEVIIHKNEALLLRPNRKQANKKSTSWDKKNG